MNRTAEAERLWRERVRGQRVSGLSVAGYCAQHGISHSSFYLWKKRLKRLRNSAARGVSRTVPLVELVAAASGDGPGRGGLIEVVLPDGLVIRCDDAVTAARIGEVVGVLRGSSCVVGEARS